jgi:hypothetical protein
MLMPHRHLEWTIDGTRGDRASCMGPAEIWLNAVLAASAGWNGCSDVHVACASVRRPIGTVSTSTIWQCGYSLSHGSAMYEQNIARAALPWHTRFIPRS